MFAALVLSLIIDGAHGSAQRARVQELRGRLGVGDEPSPGDRLSGVNARMWTILTRQGVLPFSLIFSAFWLNGQPTRFLDREDDRVFVRWFQQNLPEVSEHIVGIPTFDTYPMPYYFEFPEDPAVAPYLFQLSRVLKDDVRRINPKLKKDPVAELLLITKDHRSSIGLTIKRFGRNALNSTGLFSSVRGDFGDVLDWLIASRPDISRATSWHELVERSRAWHATFEIKKSPGGVRQGKIVMTFEDHPGWSIQQLTTRRQFDDEGDALGHCIGAARYYQKYKDGRGLYYSLRDPSGEPRLTWEFASLRPSPDTPADVRPIQLVGALNIGLVTYAEEDKSGEARAVISMAERFTREMQPNPRKWEMHGEKHVLTASVISRHDLDTDEGVIGAFREMPSFIGYHNMEDRLLEIISRGGPRAEEVIDIWEDGVHLGEIFEPPPR